MVVKLPGFGSLLFMDIKVHQVIQSKNIDNNEPVCVTWYKGSNHAEALSALVSASVHIDDTYYRVLSATIAFEE